jgi:hypothetical protein
VVLKFSVAVDNYPLDSHRRKILPIEKYASIFNLGLSSEY